MANAIYKGMCPHCGTDDVAFTSVAQVLKGKRDDGESLWNVFFSCNRCLGGVVAIVFSNRSFGPQGLGRDVGIPGFGRNQQGTVAEFKVVDTYPKPPVHAAPEHVPDRVAGVYIEASENLHRHKFETSEMLSRKALDLATKQLLPESKKKLFGRIEELRDTGKITSEMADWAHIVRDEGNGSVHSEEEVTQEEAAELLAFTETFLMYAFTLPGMIAKRRQAQEHQEDAS